MAEIVQPNLQLSEADLRFLVETVATRRKDHDHILHLVRDKDDLLDRMLEDPKLLERLRDPRDAFSRISPFMLFSICLRHLRLELKNRTYVYEIGSRGRRVPVFETSDTVSLLSDQALFDYLVGMLCSFVRTSSGVVYWRERGTWHRRRFSAPNSRGPGSLLSYSMKDKGGVTEVTEAKYGKILGSPQALTFQLQGDDLIPNSRLPLLIYRHAVKMAEAGDPTALERVFQVNHWESCWRDGIYSYHHYHSTAHEVLGVFRGTARVQFGGEHGRIQQLNAGDVVIIPAGVAHKNLESSDDFGVVGAYPAGQGPDMCYGEPGERPEADKRIARVPMPSQDPVYGARGPLLEHWRFGSESFKSP